jgi:D-alanyl-D-alanine carboxypeptidase
MNRFQRMLSKDQSFSRTRRGFVAFAAGTLLVVLAGCGSGSRRNIAPPIAAETLRRAVTTARTTYKVPAIAAAVVSAESIASEATGIRKEGTTNSVTRSDRFHVGSNGKAMTASLMAVFVEEGKVSWESKVRDILPEIEATMRSEYREMTVAQLLEHRSGLPGYDTLEDIVAVPVFPGNAMQQRQAFAQWVVQQPPIGTPGEFYYSNGGYGLAAAVIEKVGGKPWETLIQERLFRPLGITNAGFGWPATNNPNQPNGHIEPGDGTFVPHDEQNTAEQIPLVFASAGDVYITIGEFARFTQMHLRGLRGQRDVLRPETIQRMHTPNGDYAMGWLILDVEGVRTSFHDGSADTFISRIAIQPSKDRAVALVTNAGGEQGAAALDTLTESLSETRSVSLRRANLPQK